MAEFYIASAVLGLGYLLSGEKKKDKSAPVAPIPGKNLPNGDNIFDSNRVQEIRMQQQEQSDQMYDQAWNNPDSNLVIPGPWETYFKKVDYADKTLPVEFQSQPRLDNADYEHAGANFATAPFYGAGHPTSTPVSDGWRGISLTGEPIDPKNFTHNNMVPFFGSTVKQNVDEYANRNIVETFTGTSNFGKKKNEIPHLFDPQPNITNMGYGMSNMSGYQRERFVVSNIRNNEAPTEKIYVGPGLNQGYTWKPCGGFQQAAKRDYILPKTVDELRVKTNPKVTYYGRVIAGQKISRPPKIGVVQKNKPDSFAVWTPDRYFITTGSRVKPKQRPEVVLKHVNRATTDIRRAMGPAGPTQGSKESIRSNVRISEKCQYTPGGPRNMDGVGQWTIPDECEPVIENYVPMKSCPGEENFPKINALTQPEDQVSPYTDPRLNPCRGMHDYGRGGYLPRPNNREETSCVPVTNLTGFEKKSYIPITSKLRPSRRQAVIGNPRWAGFVQGPHNRNRVWDPNDIPRTTIKETLIEDVRQGNLGIQRPANPRIYDPNDIPRTTVRETTVQEQRKGNVDAARYTKPRVHDPSDVPRTTQKESVMLYSHRGDAYRPTDAGYDIACYKAPNTNRQFTSDHEYFGDAVAGEEGGYQVACPNPKATNRQFTSMRGHTGVPGNTDRQKPVSYEAMYNTTTHSLRQEVARGRTPGRQGPKEIYNVSMVNATTSKAGDLQNAALSQRPRMSTRVFNSLPQANTCGETKTKKIVPNAPIRERLDGRLLDAFRQNPFTQQLQAYWTY